MVLGLSRMQPRSAHPPITPLSGELPSSPAREHDWLLQRGAVLFEAPCDLMGGFPGFADQGGEVTGATLRISERFLTVDEGRPQGFGIPVSLLDGAVLVSHPDRDDADLRVFYADGAMERCFALRFRANRLAMRGGKRAERAHDALIAAGLSNDHYGIPSAPPDFSLPWERTREFDDEHVIWTGHATAPAQVGCELAPSEIWLSTRSLIWGSSEGSGLNRVAVDELCDVSSARLKDRAGAPAIYLSVAGETYGRYEIPFVFDQQDTTDRNFRERGAFLVGLRSRAIPDGTPAPLWQPWRLDVHPATLRPELAQGVPPPDAHAAASASGVRARLEHWLPRLQGFALRGLALPSVEQEQANVSVFNHAEPDLQFGPNVPEESGAEHREEAPEFTGWDWVSSDELLVDEPITTEAEPAFPHLDLQLIEEPESRLPQEEQRACDVEETTHPTVASEQPSSPEVLPSLDDAGFLAATSPIEYASIPDIEPSPDHELAPAVAPESQEPPLLERAALGSEVAEIAPESVTAVQRFETAALGVVADALHVIDIRLETGSLEPLSRLVSLSPARDAALAEVRALGAAKTIKKREMRRQAERLHNLADAGIRLRSLADLYDRGRLNNPELIQLRAKLIAKVELSPFVVPLTAAERETANVDGTLFGVKAASGGVSSAG